MKIKVCGITKLEQLEELAQIGVDYAGLIFYSQSPRYVLNKLISSDVRNSKIKIDKVGVFVNASEEDILTQVELYDLDAIQLHGDETPAFCLHISNHVKVIKAFHLTFKNEKHIDWMVKPYEEVCDHYLFDSSVVGKYGGTGKKFDWSILVENKINKPFFLSGGLSPDDVDTILAFQHPFFFGVDLNSKFETSEGVKNMDAIRTFRELLRSYSTKQL